MPSHRDRTTSQPLTSTRGTKPKAPSNKGDSNKREAPAHNDSMSTGTRTVGRSNVSQSGSVASTSQDVNVPFDDHSLQDERLAMFESQDSLDDSTVEARFMFQDNTDTTRGTTNNDQKACARKAFYEARATEAIRKFDNAFGANK
ncbi:hypothetical protein B0T20DRAFT_242213 [Sordaria brevicollis]|uniref:Uncharacterized protein n=1 Tax=Sordaria brevicollis TaxID=83679 RepID=A0AAE0UAC7_SORBR|nr:hypothetical protein B0T20DRAFT_242213 [Sordaria brevicollis]